MAHDLLIRGATLVDGTGAPAVRGDLAVDGGRIAALGRCEGGASRVIDASGLVLAPGFVDVHTHYDAQVAWDPFCTPSSFHGTTSVVTGNCGYALAPVRPEDRDYTMGLFSRVEQISKTTLEAGLPWEWESHADLFAWLGKRGLGVNVAPQVGHSALRRFVMGEAAHEREATPDEIRAMQRLLLAGMEAGAVGFTTSRVAHQRGEHGEPIPSFLASEEELLALAGVLGGLGRGMIGINPRTKAQEFCQADRDQLVRLARETGRPVNWNEFGQRDEWPGQWRSLLQMMESAGRAGHRVYGVMRCQRMDLHFNLADTRAFDGAPAWREVMALGREAKLARLRDPEIRSVLAREFESGFRGARPWFRRIGIAAPGDERHRGLADRLVSEVAAERGVGAIDFFLTLAAEEELRTEFAFFGLSNSDEDAVAEMLASPATVIGISDAGAHLHSFCGVDFPTHLLGHWVREKRVLSLEQAVRGLTSVPADLWGLAGRGVLRPGAAADLCVFDPDRVAPLPLEVWSDLPGGGSRHVKRARGVEWVIVNGRPVVEGGRLSGELPGAVLGG